MIGWLAALGCGDDAAIDAIEETTGGYRMLTPVEHLNRASIVLQNKRPSTQDIDAVVADPTALEGIVRAYVQTPAFLDTIGDMHAEMYLMRYDTFHVLPALGELEGYNLQQIYDSYVNEPLKLVQHVVDNDLPYTEVVTAQYMMTNEIVAKMYGLAFDPNGPEWQVSEWSDYRARAGLLSSAQMWRRWESDGSNFHRGRANLVASRFLCEDFDSRDVYVPGGIDIADEFEVANAVMVQESCVACHQSLDGLAAYFWGYKQLIHRNAVGDAINAGCEWDWSNGAVPDYGPNNMPEHFCYPLKQYVVDEEAGWERWGLRPPLYYGQQADDMTDVGQLVAGDSRFASCTARQFYAWFLETDVMEVPVPDSQRLQAVLEGSGFNAKELAVQVVLSDAFRAYAPADPAQDDGMAGLRAIRPEQLGDVVEDLTGYTWTANTDSNNCDGGGQQYGNQCWGDVELPENDRWGFRSMMGGIDHLNITRPTHTMTPLKAIVADHLSSDAAAFVYDNDFAISDPWSRRLFRFVEADTVDEVAVRAQLAHLHKRVLGIPAGPQDTDVTTSYGLYQEILGINGGDRRGAWIVVLSALLEDPRMMYL